MPLPKLLQGTPYLEDQPQDPHLHFRIDVGEFMTKVILSRLSVFHLLWISPAFSIVVIFQLEDFSLVPFTPTASFQSPEQPERDSGAVLRLSYF